VPALVEALNDKSPKVYRDVVEALEKIDAEALKKARP
jgi:hypothetical protein